MKYYTCNKCKYTFCTDKKCDRCADCGKKDIRPATEDEINQYLKFREEFKEGKRSIDKVPRLNTLALFL